MFEHLTQVGLSHYIIVSCAIFFVAFYGTVTTKQLFKKFLCAQLLLISTGLILASVAKFNSDIAFQGEVFALFITGFAFIQLFIFTAIKHYHEQQKKKETL